MKNVLFSLAVSGLVGCALFGASATMSADTAKVGRDESWGSIASGSQPAKIHVEGTTVQNASAALVEVTLKPVTVVPGEDYLVAVSVGDGAGDDVQTGGPVVADVVSFFPPPIEGESRKFLIEVPSVGAGEPITLKVELIPADSRNPLESSRVEITDAHWVQ